MRVLPDNSRRGFTLVELVVVVLSIGILAAAAAARASNTIHEAKISAIVHDLRVLEEAAERFYAANGHWPADAHRGVFPSDFEGYVDERYFTEKNAIDGFYDWNKDYGVVAGMSLWNASPPLAIWQEVDARVDDGNLTTGRMTRHSSRTLNLRLE